MSLSSIWSEFRSWWSGTTIGQEIDAAGAATLKELEVILPAALETIVESTAAALLPGITSGASTADIIAAGIAAAEAAFKSADATVASTTVSTFVSTLHNAVTTQNAAGAVTSSGSGAA
jgi:hypothetical protein